MALSAGSVVPRRRAGALLGVLAATMLAPLAALAAYSPTPREPRDCHCPARMPCCEAGLCHAGASDAPRTNPSWSCCRDEAPCRDAAPAPSSALDGALPRTVAGQAGPPDVESVLFPADGRRPIAPSPPAPPPRRLADPR